MRNMVAWLSLITAMLVWSTKAEAAYTVVSSSTDPSFNTPLVKTDTVIEDSGDARNRFTVHRVVRASHTNHKGSVILLPSLVSNFKEYTFSETGNSAASLAAQLALANFDVWGFSPRTAQVPPNGCSSGSFDCSVMSNWGLATYTSDINYIKGQIAIAHPGEKPVVGGFSLGAMQGIAAINNSPGDYSGLILWDGILYTTDLSVNLLNVANCQQDVLTMTGGTYYNEVLPNAAKLSANTGEAALVQLFGTPDPILGTPGFVVAVPNLLRTQFLYTNFPRIKQSVIDFNNVESVAILRDLHCSLAGDRTFTNNLGSFTGRIFTVKAGQGYGPYTNPQVALFTSAAAVETHDTPAFGHGDAYFSANHATYIDTPLVTWLNTVTF